MAAINEPFEPVTVPFRQAAWAANGFRVLAPRYLSQESIDTRLITKARSRFSAHFQRPGTCRMGGWARH